MTIIFDYKIHHYASDSKKNIQTFYIKKFYCEDFFLIEVQFEILHINTWHLSYTLFAPFYFKSKLTLEFTTAY